MHSQQIAKTERRVAVSAANPTIPPHPTRHASNDISHLVRRPIDVRDMHSHQIDKTQRRVAVSAANPTIPSHPTRHASNDISRLVKRQIGVCYWQWWGSLRAGLYGGVRCAHHHPTEVHLTRLQDIASTRRVKTRLTGFRNE